MADLDQEPNEERINAVIFGVTIGTSNGWDQGDTFSISLYDFEPNEKFKMMGKGDLFVDYEAGNLEVFGGESGNITKFTSNNNPEFWTLFASELTGAK